MTTPPRDAAALAPCPFCGSSNVAQGASRDQISVWCFCGARGPDVPFPENCDPVPPIRECHALWNTRTEIAAALRAPLSTPTESHRLAAEEIDAYYVAFVEEALKTLRDGGKERTRAEVRRDVASLITKHCAPLPLSGDEWLEKAARHHDDAADTVAAEHPGIQGSKSQKRRRRHHIESAAAIRALKSTPPSSRKTTPTDGGEG